MCLRTLFGYTRTFNPDARDHAVWRNQSHKVHESKCLHGVSERVKLPSSKILLK